MKFASLIFALCFLASALASKPAHAATLTASFSVSATVVSSCRASAPATAFGTYSAAGTNATSSVSVTCTNPTPYNVSYGTSLATSATATKRKMAGPARGSSQPYAGYGRTAWSQPVAPGAFADSVTVTVAY